MWGFLPAGLKEVLEEVGDFQALVVEQADRERKKAGKSGSFTSCPTPHYLKMAFGELQVARWPVTFI